MLTHGAKVCMNPGCGQPVIGRRKEARCCSRKCTEACSAAREKLRRRHRKGSRQRTLSEKALRLLPKEPLNNLDELKLLERPITRGDCVGGARPCPLVGCKFNMYLDVNPEIGSIKLNFPDLEVWEMKESCVLDVADKGGVTLEETGALLNLTRERIRQVEVRGLLKLRTEGIDR